MTQSEILKILKKLDENEWISTKELIKITKLGKSSLYSNISKLRQSGEVESRSIEIEGWGCNAQQEHRLTWEGRLDDIN